MRREFATEENRSAAMTPWRVVEVRPLEDFQLDVRFADQTTGRVDLRQMIGSDRAGVFSALRDRELFERVGVDHGAVCWPGDIDLASDAMYAAIRRDGVWQLT